jgi:methylglutaconyl-CoA hydratase
MKAMLIAESHGSIRSLTLNRPDVRNAFNDELIEALNHEFAHLDPGIRVVTLRGKGPSFCAGGDLEWMRRASAYTEEQNVADAMKLGELLDRMVNCRAVVIAVAHGAAFGGGAGLLAAADYAVAVQGTKFSFSEVKLGLVPAMISTVVVPKIGVGHARALFSTGIVFEADRALRMGLVHSVAEDLHAAEAEVHAVTRSVLHSGPNACYLSKVLAQEAPLSLEQAARRLAQARASDEGKEGLSAFLDKRKASFIEEVFD